MHERLIAQRGANALYVVRSQTADNDSNGPGMSLNPFNAMARLQDWWGGYVDYTLTEVEAKAELSEFESQNTTKGLVLS